VIERKSDGTIWFTSPLYGIISDNEGYKSENQIIGCYVYCYDPKSQLAFSPDESTLYVADMSVVDFPTHGMKHIKAFDILGKTQ
jgi:gluconolactonase